MMVLFQRSSRDEPLDLPGVSVIRRLLNTLCDVFTGSLRPFQPLWTTLEKSTAC